MLLEAKMSLKLLRLPRSMGFGVTRGLSATVACGGTALVEAKLVDLRSET